MADLILVLQIVTPIMAILLGINGYFIRGLVVKIQDSERAVWQSNERINNLQREMKETRDIFMEIGDHVSKIDSDIAVLKFAILKQIKRMESEQNGT